MAVYYKLAFEGTAGGQNIVNLLYFGDDVGEGFASWSESTADDILDAANETYVETYVGGLPTHYTLSQLTVTGINERGVVVSPYDRVLVINEPGVQVQGTSGSFVTSILPFVTSVASGAALNMKRSYLAYGPLGEGFVDNDQSLSATGLAAVAPVAAMFDNTLGGAIGEYVPLRIGRTVAPAPIRIGRVEFCSLRPYASIRTSRKKTPRGT